MKKGRLVSRFCGMRDHNETRPLAGAAPETSSMRTTRLLTCASTLTADVVAAVVAVSHGSGPSSLTHFGPVVSFGQGTARSFVELDAGGAPKAIGLTLSESALSGLPQTSPGPSPTAIMATLPLPPDIARFG